MSLNESICGVSFSAIGWILHGHPTCLTPGNHDESAPTAAPDCFLTFNSVSSCAWMNMGRVMDSGSNVLQQVGRRAPVSHGNYGGLDRYSRSSPPHNPHTPAILTVVQPLIQCCVLWFFSLWSVLSPLPKSKDLLSSGDREGAVMKQREIWIHLIHSINLWNHYEKQTNEWISRKQANPIIAKQINKIITTLNIWRKEWTNTIISCSLLKYGTKGGRDEQTSRKINT